MKSFLEKVFKPYIFPLIILIIGAYLKAGENLKSVSSFFSNSSNSFFKFLSRQFFLWEVILYLIVVFLFIRFYKLIFKHKSKKEKRMQKAIKKIPHEHNVSIKQSTDKYLFKFEPKVINEKYFIDNFRPYCQNCSAVPLRMSIYGGYSEFRCNCGRIVGFNLCQDVKSRIITALEALE